MKILITGSCGFIGFNLAEKLLKVKKNKVCGIDNINSYYSVKLKKERLKVLCKNKNFKFYKVDICKFEKLENRPSTYQRRRSAYQDLRAAVNVPKKTFGIPSFRGESLGIVNSSISVSAYPWA